MKLRFFAKPGHFERVPGPFTPVRYIGREPKEVGERTVFVALEKPVEFDLDSTEGRQVFRQMRVQNPAPLWPADEATANAVGLPLPKLEYREGEHHEVKPVEVSAASSASEGAPEGAGSNDPSPGTPEAADSETSSASEGATPSSSTEAADAAPKAARGKNSTK